VEAISSNWMYKLGEGGFGSVYYGEMFSDTSPNADPQKVALKRLSATSQQGNNEFLNEVPSYESYFPITTLIPFHLNKWWQCGTASINIGNYKMKLHNLSIVIYACLLTMYCTSEVRRFDSR